MDGMNDYLVGVRLRATAQADDYRVGDLELHVGDLVLVETADESAVGAVRGAKGETPEAKRERRSRVEMRQIGARDTTKILDGIGPCGRQLCCTSHLRRFDPISVKMAKTQDMPLTDNRLLGNCGRLKCCLLYEFSTYEELRSRLPRVNSPCQANCGTSGCMTGKVRSIRVLKQSVIVGFPDGTQAQVPVDQVTWEVRAHIKAQL